MQDVAMPAGSRKARGEIVPINREPGLSGLLCGERKAQVKRIDALETAQQPQYVARAAPIEHIIRLGRQHIDIAAIERTRSLKPAFRSGIIEPDRNFREYRQRPDLLR